ncbi:MAG: O-acetylhomoserine aminocarboxypropyltransferase/cysteine synthase [Candidatus Moranbacteria bacterium]|nr:O-acetylhomoserine aminocarboxypropyltransferase/cysteine synthase [Candidatus Moranbacteria bacterium]
MTNSIETSSLHAGQVPEPTTLSRGVPVYRTTSYVFKNAKHASDLFALKELGNIYTRLMNPTTDVLEKRIAELEGGVAAVAVASGTAAIFYAIINVCRAGDEIVSASNLYGGTHTMFKSVLPQFGITTRFVNVHDHEAFKKAITEKTRAVFIETIGNPALEVADIEAIAKIAHEAGLPLIVDSTFTPPTLLQPIKHGADVVIHSLTKWIGGHGSAIGGIVVDAGKFDWTDAKFSLFNEPEASYHGLRFAHDLGALSPLCYALRLRLVPLRTLGACISPDNAWIILQGVETLPLRTARHSENALKVAQFLKHHKQVDWVRYPGLSDDPSHALASKYLKNGFGGMVVFGVKGGLDAGVKFINSVKLISHLANVGDAKSLVLHPASTSHSQLSEEDRSRAGLPPELIRLSVGLENVEDIIADIEQALA